VTEDTLCQSHVNIANVCINSKLLDYKLSCFIDKFATSCVTNAFQLFWQMCNFLLYNVGESGV